MPRKRKENSPSRMKLKQPDRSAPTEETLLQFAQERGLFEQAKSREQQNKSQPYAAAESTDNDDDSGMPPAVERIFDTLLWMVSLSMLHFTLDVLVQNQYAVEISWAQVSQRAFEAFVGMFVACYPGVDFPIPPNSTKLTISARQVFSVLFYVLHPHPSKPNMIPGLASRFQAPIRQALFFAAGTCAGCYLIHITNKHGYLAVMKQAPPLGCIWVWSVIELDLLLAVLSLASTAAFLWYGGYDFK